jgi:hypothetical protein
MDLLQIIILRRQMDMALLHLATFQLRLEVMAIQEL